MTGIALQRSLSHHVLRLLEFLHAWVSRESAIDELEALPDAALRDVGLERADIGARVDLEMSRIGRLGLGR